MIFPDDHTITAYGIGTVELQARFGNKTSIITLCDVLYTPNAVHNLISLTCLDKEGGFSVLGGGQVKLYDRNKNLFAIANLQDGIYTLCACRHVPVECAYQACTWEDWHQCFGHIGIRGLQWLQCKGLVLKSHMHPVQYVNRVCTSMWYLQSCVV